MNLCCHECKKTILQSEDAIKCVSNCGEVFHKRCTKLSEIQFKVIKESDNIKWICNSCTWSTVCITSLREQMEELSSALKQVNETNLQTIAKKNQANPMEKTPKSLGAESTNQETLRENQEPENPNAQKSNQSSYATVTSRRVHRLKNKLNKQETPKTGSHEPQIREEVGDIFDLDQSISLVHCISADFSMSQGIAVEFDKKFPEIKNLRQDHSGTSGSCAILKEGPRFIYSLVTKQLYHNKPTESALQKSVEMMVAHCHKNKVKCLGMPYIGCGKDKLKWHRVKAIIQEAIKDKDLTILVRGLPRKQGDERKNEVSAKKMRSVHTIVGTSTALDQGGFKTAPRRAFFHLSRTEKATTVENILEYLQNRHPDEEFECEQLSNSEAPSKSFKLVANHNMLETLSDPAAWPAGVAVRRFFRKTQSTQVQR